VARHDAIIKPIEPAAVLHDSVVAATTASRRPAGRLPQPYAVYVDETDAVWVSDWGANAILRFDPKTEKFDSFPLPDRYAGVRQLAGCKGEVRGAESGADKRFVLKTE
jgi:virginiamycin B lyase